MIRALRLALLIRAAPRQPREEWQHTRRAVLVRDGDRCRFRRAFGWGPVCGRPAEHVDHVVPVSWGGSSDASNLRAACARCNLRKGSRPPAGWLALRVGRAVAVYGVVTWLLFSAPTIAPAAIQRWAVVAPGGQVVAAFESRAAAERAAAGWNAAGGAGMLAVAPRP